MRHAFRVINMRKGYLVAYDLTRVVSSFSSERATDRSIAKMRLKFFKISTSSTRRLGLVSKISFSSKRTERQLFRRKVLFYVTLDVEVDR